jgi:MFS family permease
MQFLADNARLTASIIVQPLPRHRPNMASSALAIALARRNIHYGWVVVAVTFLTMLVTAGAMGSPGVMIVPLEREFGWDNAQISTALALRILLFGLFGPFAAAFMNQFGVRRVVVCALALIAAGFLASLGMTRVWQLILLWGVVIGFGTGLTAIVLAATVATRWFTQRRGLVVGLLSASSATGQLVFLPLIAELTERFGWRMALVFVCGLLALAALAAAALMRDRPSDLGLPPYGETVVTPPPAMSAGLASLLLAPLVALRDAAGVPLFWVLFATFFICGASTNGLIQTSVPAGSPIASTIAGCCSGITACAGCRSSISRSPTSRFTTFRSSPCSTASTGSRPCRRR